MDSKIYELKKLIDQGIRPSVLAKSYHDLVSYLISITTFLPDDSPIKRRMWHINHDMYNIPTCRCGQHEIYFRKRTLEYSEWCYKCLKKEEQLNRERANIEKYGHKSTLTVPEYAAKGKQTIFNTFGVEYITQSPDIREQIKQTNREKYGVENVSANSDIKNKKSKTLLANYGVTTPSKSKTIYDKITATNIERYGVPNPLQNDDIKKKAIATNIERYGVPNPLQNDDIKKKAIATNIERYNRDAYAQKHISLQSLEILNSGEKLEELNERYSCPQIADILGCSHSCVINYFDKHDISPKIFFTSTAEIEIREVFKDIDCIFNDRKFIGKELDIYIPKLKLAIEYNGLYWHGDITGTDKNLHYMKFKKCKENGVRLITIFENEWTHNKSLVIKKLKHIVNMSTERKIYARKCVIVNVLNSDKDIFFNNNHIQGSAKATITIGLKYDGELVACMAFTKNQSGFLLTRYATSCNVVGGFTKLLHHFERENNSPKIITFADQRWSNGDVYKNSGFILDKELKPDYYWCKNNKLWHKFNWRHKQMKTKLKMYDNKKSESENMYANGYWKIWDCGKLKFSKN